MDFLFLQVGTVFSQEWIVMQTDSYSYSSFLRGAEQASLAQQGPSCVLQGLSLERPQAP